MALILNQAEAEAVANAMAHLNNVGAMAHFWMREPSLAQVRIGRRRVRVTKRLPSCSHPYEAEDYPTQHDFLIAYGLE